MSGYTIDRPDKYMNRVYVRGLNQVQAKTFLWDIRENHEELRASTELLKNGTVLVESVDNRDIQSDNYFLTELDNHVSQAYWGTQNN